MNRSSSSFFALACFLGPLLSACGADSSSASPVTPSATAGTAGGPSGGGAGSGSAGSNSSGGLMIVVPPMSGSDGGGTSNGNTPIMLTDVIKTELGGYKRGEEVTDGMSSAGV